MSTPNTALKALQAIPPSPEWPYLPRSVRAAIEAGIAALLAPAADAMADMVVTSLGFTVTHIPSSAVRAQDAAAPVPVPFKPETWPLDADGSVPNLCTECGTPVRYGSRHSDCGHKAMGLATSPAAAQVQEERGPHTCIRPHCPTDCSVCNHAIEPQDEARQIILQLLQEFAKDGHGGEFEDGEHPLVDRARKYLQCARLNKEPSVQAPSRSPLTEEQIEAGREATFSVNNPFCPCDRKTMLKAVRWAERAHNIGGGEGNANSGRARS